MGMKYDGISVQNMRSSNMDGVLLKERLIEGRRVYLAVVCDGVGSMINGAFASATSTELLSEWFNTVNERKSLGVRMLNAVAEINRVITEEAERKALQTASTLSALLVDESNYYIVHVGDSRIYGFRDGVLRQLTQDHTRGGRLTACIGRTENVSFFYDEGTYAGDTFLLCSDGLYKRMEHSKIERNLAGIKKHGLQKVIKQMVEFVIDQGERDNISLAILMKES